MKDVTTLILDKIDGVSEQLKKLEEKVEKHTETINSFKLETLHKQAICREDCHAKINKLRFTMAKLLGVAAAGGLAGEGLDYLLKLI